MILGSSMCCLLNGDQKQTRLEFSWRSLVQGGLIGGPEDLVDRFGTLLPM